jgi:hypothetical protein
MKSPNYCGKHAERFDNFLKVVKSDSFIAK